MKETTVLESAGPRPENLEYRAAALSLAGSITATRTHSKRRGRKIKPWHSRRILSQAAASAEKSRAWVLEGPRLIRTAEKEGLEFAGGMDRFPVAVQSGGIETPRVMLIARAYLDCSGERFSEETLVSFVNAFQELAVLEMGEIWALKPALQLELLDRLAAAHPSHWPELVTSLRHVGETAWKDLFEAASRVERELESDPAGVYAAMDFESRDRYRKVIGSLAKHSPCSEAEIAQAAVALSKEGTAECDGSRFAARRTHVGYYLADGGLKLLRERIRYRLPWRGRLARLLLNQPTAFYLIGIELLTFLLVAGALQHFNAAIPIFAGLILLMLPATQVAVDLINHLVTHLTPPRVLPKLDFSEGVPRDCATIVAVPTLLISDAQVRDLALDLEIRFLANRDPNIYFALLTDSPDSDQLAGGDELVQLCSELIKGLNRRYPGSPFFLFHRHRVYNDSEGRWMGWERKRGKLLDLNSLMRGAFDAFPVKVGELSLLPGIRYVITLDSDTQLPRDTAARLIGAIAHPLNRAVIDPQRRIVVEGYGILQPRIGISIQSAARSRLAALYSGETGFDIYTRAVSDAYQDLFGEGIFTGKGIYEVDALREVLEQRFPDNTLLSHDLIEGAYARVALVSDIELIDDYPSHFSAFNRRKYRWVRGDWQIVRWIFTSVPDYRQRLVPNPISLISRWKIVDNLRRSLIEPSLLILLLAGWLYLPGQPVFWTVAALAMLFFPAYWGLLFSLPRAPRGYRPFLAWAHDTFQSFAKSHAIALFSVIFLLHQALVSIDAIARSVRRVFVTGRQLLEWESAAEAETATRSKATVDVYLEWTPWLAIVIAVGVWLVRPAALPAAAPIVALWLISRAVSAWLNRPPRATTRALAKQDTEWLRENGEKICRFFRDWSSPATHWLIPDLVREDGEMALRLSPTNLGMLLNARIAAVHFGVLSMTEFIVETRETLGSLAALPKYRGHLLNWYDIETLKAVEPRFVSTVDSGNLACCLWTLKQAALAFAGEPRTKHPITSGMAAELMEIAGICDRLMREMDFRFLYDRRRKALSVGYDLAEQRISPSCYDLLASEARIAVFIAIAKGDIPQEAWFHLGRSHTLLRGERILLSWTGTMFEYLMPLLWMRHYPGTITAQSTRAAVEAQRDHGRRKGVPWGISESACGGGEPGQSGYAAFGISALALKRTEKQLLVVSPYSTMLALSVDPRAALANLRQMEQYGWMGRYGFFEAVDYTGTGGEVIRAWMAHHQGMALLSICNLLFDRPLQKYFHAEPQVLATELLLHERVPAASVAESDDDALMNAATPASKAAWEGEG